MPAERRDPTVDIALGRVIARARTEAGISQETLANSAGLHATYVSQLERGLKSPTVRVLLALASALNLPASGLLDQVESKLAATRRASTRRFR